MKEPTVRIDHYYIFFNQAAWKAMGEPARVDAITSHDMSSLTFEPVEQKGVGWAVCGAGHVISCPGVVRQLRDAGWDVGHYILRELDVGWTIRRYLQ